MKTPAGGTSKVKAKRKTTRRGHLLCSGTARTTLKSAYLFAEHAEDIPLGHMLFMPLITRDDEDQHSFVAVLVSITKVISFDYSEKLDDIHERTRGLQNEENHSERREYFRTR